MRDGWEKAYGCTSRNLATIADYRRAFDKGSVERWGTKEHPGPTLVLVRDKGAECTGVAFEFPDEREQDILAYLAHREGAKFDLSIQQVTLIEGLTVAATVPMYSGSTRIRATSLAALATMILKSRGAEGSCYDYVKSIKASLDSDGITDSTVTTVWGALEAEQPLGANADRQTGDSRYAVSFTTDPSFVQWLGQHIILDYATGKGRTEYTLSHDAPHDCHWIRPIDATTGAEACGIARHVLNLYLDKLSVEVGCGWLLTYDHSYQNLDDHSDRGRIARLRLSGLSEASHFPDRVTVNETTTSAAYYRQGLTANEPFEQYRNFYLSIEEAGKRGRKTIDPNAQAESTVLEDTVEEVFEKTSGPDLQTFRSQLPEAELPLHFQGGKGHAKHCVNEFFYHMYRCALMHSGKTRKPGTLDEKDTFAPFNPADEERVSAVLPLIAALARRYVTYDCEQSG
jgi:glutathione-specific gamma-glutamylcyclotransferase